ncbi:MAG: iron ABC transporter permease [Epulopiscium sp. Nele67-Bin001]|nr:MAG: iron ABC transporter permease [Epulopiscium sp. Nuni2H_MBin001]OON90220.1 MAG: iron ABC transporter permease [Epulopiscium sp. Nele67-Bin001]
MIRKYRLAIILAVILFVLSFLSLFVGVLDITPILKGDFEAFEIVLISRLPRLMAIICTGVGMSIAGLIMQQLCMNKFVSPTTGATIASAQLGRLLAMLVFTGTTLAQQTLMSFAFALLGTWIFVWLIQTIKFKDVIMVPLIGIMFSNVIGGVTSYFAYKYNMTQALSAILVGDFSLIIRGRYEIVYLIVPLVIIAYIYANHFNIVGMGENFAKNLGVNYNRMMFFGLSIAALITASIVVIVGTISYIGLIVPNIVSMFRGDKIQGSLVEVGLVGAIFVLICDVIGRLIIFPYELPIDLVAGVIGSILFLGIMYRRLRVPKPKIRVEGR